MNDFYFDVMNKMDVKDKWADKSLKKDHNKKEKKGTMDIKGLRLRRLGYYRVYILPKMDLM